MSKDSVILYCHYYTLVKFLPMLLLKNFCAFFTGKFFSEALILASTNPQYDKRLLIDLPVQYMKTASSEHVVYINCFECQNKNNLCTQHVLSL